MTSAEEFATPSLDQWTDRCSFFGIMLFCLGICWAAVERTAPEPKLPTSVTAIVVRPSFPSDDGRELHTSESADASDFDWAPIELPSFNPVTPAVSSSLLDVDARVESLDGTEDRKSRLREKIQRCEKFNLMYGVCRDREERPIRAVQVTLYRRVREVGSTLPRREVVATATSDDDGFYELGPRPADYFQSGLYEKERLKEGYTKGIGYMDPARHVSGRVTRPDGEPLANASVSAIGAWPDRNVETDALGNFLLRNVPVPRQRGLAQLSITHSQFGGMHVYVQPGFEPVEAQFASPAIVRGKIVGPDVEPVVGATVRVFSDNSAQSLRVQSDATGRFEVLLQGDGICSLHVDHHELIAPPLGSGWSRLPSTDGFAKSDTGIAFVHGEVRHAPIIRMRRPSLVRGKLLDAESGQPIRLRPTEHVSVAASNSWGSTATNSVVDVQPDGTFLLPVLPGGIKVYFSQMHFERSLQPIHSMMDVSVGIEAEVEIVIHMKESTL